MAALKRLPNRSRGGDAGVSRLRRVGLSIWDFVVGDDWRAAIGVVLALGLTAVAAALGASAWWVMPAVVPVLLVLSVRRALPPR